MKKGKVYMNNTLAGIIYEDDEGYKFEYDQSYLKGRNQPVSLTLPLQEKPFKSRVLFPFFDGLIPEGWLLHIAEKNWKINPRNRMELLLNTCEDCIGAVSVRK